MTDSPLTHCRDDRRRNLLREDGRFTGIDFIEVDTDSEGRPVLLVNLLGPLPGDPTAWLDVSNLLVSGHPGSRPLQIVDLGFRQSLDDERDDHVVITLDHEGDQSRYALELVGTEQRPLTDVDQRYASAEFSFVIDDSPAEMDCQEPDPPCALDDSSAPDIDYLAKDYTSFRQLLLDRLATTLPDWRAENSPDLYLTIIETLAYHADQLSYAQDAVGTEAYLDTARLRTSIRRHTRLVDYRMHEGTNARAWVCLEVEGNPSVRADQVQFLTRPVGAPSDAVVLLGDELLRFTRAGHEVFEPLPEHGWEEIASRDVRDPLALARRLLDEHVPEVRALRAASPEDLLADLAAALRADVEPQRLVPILQRLLTVAMADHSLATAVPGADATIGRYGSTNALRGALLRRHNRCRLQEVFPDELVEPTRYRFHEAHNRISFYTWHRTECCLPQGATSVALQDGWLADRRGRLLDHLNVGDVLIFEELVNPRTGNSADADPGHRHPVRLTSIQREVDPLGNIPVVRIGWDPVDALPFALTISTIGAPPQCRLLSDVSVARGNVMLVDHGETVLRPEQLILHDGARTFPVSPFEPPGDIVPPGEIEWCCAGEHRLIERTGRAGRYSPRLAGSPVVFAQELPSPPPPARDVLRQDPRRASPQVALFNRVVRGDPRGDVLTGELDGRPVLYDRWLPRNDLLRSGATDRHFVVETDDTGIAQLRFGDGELGASPAAGTRFLAWYRVGGGPSGNVGAEAISTVLLSGTFEGGSVLRVRNPLQAVGGVGPERVADVKVLAPYAFRQTLRRAVTLDDYAAIALRDFPDRIQRAAARWAGQVDNRSQVEVLVDPIRTTADDPELRADILRHLRHFRRIGHRLMVVPAEYVCVRLALSVSLAPHHQRGAVLRELRERLGSGTRRDGGQGLFHPDQLTFGQAIAVSAILAAAFEVSGVAAVEVTALQDIAASGAGTPAVPADDELSVEPWQIARLDDDPHRPANGQLEITLKEATS
jgi:hypothetical protein